MESQTALAESKQAKSGGSLAELFGLDPRSLAAFRIGLAALMLIDIFWRLFDVEAFYTDFGVLPRHTYTQLFANKYVMSFHMMSGQAYVQYILLGIQAVFATAMLVGYRTRIATVLAWVFLISLHGRNPYILQGGDILFRMFFFWAMFLPTGATWSVDSALDQEGKDPVPAGIMSAGSIALMLQIFFVYWFTMGLKTGSEWLRDFTAVHYALHLDHFATPLAEWIREYDWLTTALTVITSVVEVLGPIVALVAGRTWVRMGAVVVMIGMHISFGATLKIGLFPWISIVGWFALIPSVFWDRLGLALQSARESRKLHAWLVDLGLTKHLTARPVRWRSSKFAHVLCSLALLMVLVWNIDGMERPTTIKLGPLKTSFSAPKLDQRIKKVGWFFRLDQKWTMFAPRPMKGDGWFIVPGTFADGSVQDLFSNEQDGGEPVNFEKPDSVSSMYAGQRWRKYMINIWMRDTKKHRRHYGAWLCRKWNRDKSPAEKLKLIHIYYMREMTLPDGPGLPHCVTLWTHWCTGDAKDLPDPPHVAQCKAITDGSKAAEAAEKASAGGDAAPKKDVGEPQAKDI
ncbi:MAG: hypothetical protein ACI9OJ_005620 [Myxococcota bacterium]|jgi:hypothetical protein